MIGSEHVNILFRHQADNRTKHTQPKKKESLRVKSKNKMPPSLLEKKDKNLRKSKNEKKMERKKGYILFPLSCNFQFGTGRKKKYLRRPCGHYRLNHLCFSL